MFGTASTGRESAFGMVLQAAMLMANAVKPTKRPLFLRTRAVKETALVAELGVLR